MRGGPIQTSPTNPALHFSAAGRCTFRLPITAGRHPRAPQRFGDVLDPPDAHPGQVHLHERLLDRRLASPVPLDDLRLERQAPQARDLQLHLARLRLQLPLVRAGSRVHSLGRPLVAARPAQPVRLRVQQPIERLLDARADHLVHVTTHGLLVHPDHPAIHASCYTRHRSPPGLGRGSNLTTRFLPGRGGLWYVRNYPDVIVPGSRTSGFQAILLMRQCDEYL